MLTVYDDNDRIFEALRAGASGYLLKNTPPARLLEGLKEATAGGAPMSPEVAQRVVALFREFPPTISFHLQRIYEKLHVHSKSEAVAKALRSRIV